ncbi:MAG: hypothetical protein WDZ67_01310 [Patescibacteria group bacterium]
MDPEISLEEENNPKEDKAKPRRRINWRKIGLGFVLFLATLAVFAAGYLAVILWQKYFPDSFLTGPDPYENWQVYRSETHSLGLRYSDSWEAGEVNANFVVFRQKAQAEGEVLPKDYVSLAVISNANRGKTACENDQSACSFFANDIYGDRIITPESETIFFSKGENDFTLTWWKYGEDGASYASIFEEMGKSLRFVTEETPESENEAP